MFIMKQMEAAQSHSLKVVLCPFRFKKMSILELPGNPLNQGTSRPLFIPEQRDTLCIISPEMSLGGCRTSPTLKGFSSRC